MGNEIELGKSVRLERGLGKIKQKYSIKASVFSRLRILYKMISRFFRTDTLNTQRIRGYQYFKTANTSIC